jgi:hypothetical protein
MIEMRAHTMDNRAIVAALLALAAFASTNAAKAQQAQKAAVRRAPPPMRLLI